MTDDPGRGSAPILYCHCAFANVVPAATKDAVLRALSGTERGFDAVADLCELSARRDPSLARLVAPGGTRIAACHPRAVRWLFHAAGTTLPDDALVWNMRDLPADVVIDGLLAGTPPPPPEEERT